MISRSPIAARLAKQVAARQAMPANEPVAISIDETGAMWLTMRDGTTTAVVFGGLPATGERTAELLSRMAPQHFRLGDPLPLGAMFVVKKQPDGSIIFDKFDSSGQPN